MSQSSKSEYKIALDKSLRKFDENGYLHIESNHITKATVNPYYGYEIPGYEKLNLDPQKIYQGLRDPKELEASLPTWSGIPLHLEHHIDSAEDPQKDTRVGTVGTEIKWNYPYIDAPLVVWDQEAINAIENGSFKELSCAYRYEPDFTTGEFEGVKYDFIMRNIRGNHVALVEEGRAGHEVVVSDSALNSKGTNMADEEKKDEGQAIEPSLKEAMDKCGLDSDDEAQAKAFAEGVKFAKENLEENQEPPSQDEEPEGEKEAQDDTGEASEPEEATQDNDIFAKIIESVPDLSDAQKEVIKAIFEQGGEATDEEATEEIEATDEEMTNPENKEPETAEDKALKSKSKSKPKSKFRGALDATTIKAQATKSALKTLRSIDTAIQKVTPLVGKMNVIAFDSANGVYKSALLQLGKKPENYPAQAWEGMIDVLLQEKAALASNYIATDSKRIPNEGPFAHLNKIRLSR